MNLQQIKKYTDKGDYIRWFLSLFMTIGVFSETGYCTALFTCLMIVYIETRYIQAQTDREWMRSINDIMEAIFKELK